MDRRSTFPGAMRSWWIRSSSQSAGKVAFLLYRAGILALLVVPVSAGAELRVDSASVDVLLCCKQCSAEGNGLVVRTTDVRMSLLHHAAVFSADDAEHALLKRLVIRPEAQCPKPRPGEPKRHPPSGCASTVAGYGR